MNRANNKWEKVPKNRERTFFYAKSLEYSKKLLPLQQVMFTLTHDILHICSMLSESPPRNFTSKETILLRELP